MVLPQCAPASCYLLKDTPREGLISAVRETLQGKTTSNPSKRAAVNHIAQPPRTAPQRRRRRPGSPSRRDLTCCACCPRPDQPDIAQALYLSEATVRNYVIAIFTKLNVSDRTQAAILALRAGLGDRS